MGLIGDAAAAGALTAALSDANPLIQGRAAEALGLLAHKAAAPAVAAMVTAHVNAGALNDVTPDDMAHPKTPATEAVRLGLYALVRLGSYDAPPVRWLDANGRPRSAGGHCIRVCNASTTRGQCRPCSVVERRRTADARVCGAGTRPDEGSRAAGRCSPSPRTQANQPRFASRRLRGVACWATRAPPARAAADRMPKGDHNLQLER